MPGKLGDIFRGIVFKFDITEGFLLTILASMSIPALMIFLSVVLSAKVNRLVNMIVASVYVPYTLFNLVGERPWMHMVFAAVAEVVLLCAIIYDAWKWPRNEA